MKTKLLFLAMTLGVVHLTSASELFIKVNKSGNFYANTSGQTIYSNNAIFRFFDLNSGNINIQIIDQSTNTYLVNTSINVANNKRVVAEVDFNGNISIIQTLDLQVSNWYTSNCNGSQYNGNNNSGNNNGNYNNGSGNIYTNSTDISAILSSMENESFDSKRLTKGKSYVAKTWLTSAQIKQLCETFTFDDNKLEFAKVAYATCSDKQNYFTLEKAFTFSTNYDELEEFINQ